MKMLKQLFLIMVFTVGLSMTAMAQKNDQKEKPPKKDPAEIPAKEKNRPKDEPKNDNRNDERRGKKPQNVIFVSGDQVEISFD